MNLKKEIEKRINDILDLYDKKNIPIEHTRKYLKKHFKDVVLPKLKDIENKEKDIAVFNELAIKIFNTVLLDREYHHKDTKKKVKVNEDIRNSPLGKLDFSRPPRKLTKKEIPPLNDSIYLKICDFLIKNQFDFGGGRSYFLKRFNDIMADDNYDLVEKTKYLVNILRSSFNLYDFGSWASIGILKILQDNIDKPESSNYEEWVEEKVTLKYKDFIKKVK